MLKGLSLIKYNYFWIAAYYYSKWTVLPFAEKLMQCYSFRYPLMGSHATDTNHFYKYFLRIVEYIHLFHVTTPDFRSFFMQIQARASP